MKTIKEYYESNNIYDDGVFELVQEFMSDFNLNLDSVFFCEEVYKHRATYASFIDKDKIAYLHCTLGYRDELSPWITLSLLQYEDDVDITVYSLTPSDVDKYKKEYIQEVDKYKKEYIQELDLIESKYAMLFDGDEDV